MRCCTDRAKRKVQSAKRLLFALCVLHFALPLEACPLCSEAISKVTGLARGITWSILLMITVPVLVITVISGVIVKAHRRASK